MYPNIFEVGNMMASGRDPDPDYKHPYLGNSKYQDKIIQAQIANGKANPENDPLRANGRQEGGKHYSDGVTIQTWDFIVDHKMNYLAGNVVKYVDRYKKKNGKEDLLKARHYLDKLIETEYPE